MTTRALGLLLLALLTGCSIIPKWVSSNAPLPAEGPTRANLVLTSEDLSGGVFVGIALSGGGMRAANFSAAVLLELESLGLLRHTSAISSVSGGSLTAAYYGLFGPVDGRQETARADRWNATAVKERFLIDLQTHWILRWFNPWHAIRYWTTAFDRSDIMKQVLDSYLLGTPEKKHPTFSDMRLGRPKILLNATSIPRAARFVFTDKSFNDLGSRLDTYPLSHAVMASAAFPGAFHNVTLTNHRLTGEYEHLFDGGPSDNLGADALIDLLDRAATKPRGCFLFLVDAYPYSKNRGYKEFDTRTVSDFFIDQNVSDSGSVFLTLTRERTLHRIGLPAHQVPGDVPQWNYERDGYTCRIWHLTFESFFIRPSAIRAGQETLQDMAEQREVEKDLAEHREAGQVPTSFRLKGPEVQKILFNAARYLVREDGQALRDACAWFEAQGLPPCTMPRSS
jgi:predicted acylesterase/phospholipase RssA